MITYVAFLVLLLGGLIFGYEALAGEIRGTGLKFVAICACVSSVLLLSKLRIRQKLVSGAGIDDNEGMTVDADFSDFKLNGKIKGVILN
jgi:hypothetical protein